MNELDRLRYVVLFGTGLLYFLSLVFAYLIGLSVDYGSFAASAAFLAALVGIASLIASRLKFVLLRSIAECLGCGILLVAPLTLMSYTAAKLNFPLADSLLMQWDQALGFDWVAFVRWVDNRPLVAGVFNYAYRSFSFQLMLCPLILAMLNKHVRAYQFIAVYGTMCLLLSIVSTFFPALGTYIFYEFDQETLNYLDPTYGYFFLNQFHAVRNDPDFIWKLTESAGIVTFPSGHAGIALLCAWAMWTSVWLRYPFLLLNIAMATSAVPSANHYVVDVVAGCIIAIVSIAAIKAATRLKLGGVMTV